MKLLDTLLQTREQKLAELQEKLRARDEAVGAIRLVKKLTAELPERIKAIEQELVDPTYSTFLAAEEDAVASSMVERAEGLAALRSLLSELPDILAHWERRLLKLNGGKAA